MESDFVEAEAEESKTRREINWKYRPKQKHKSQSNEASGVNLRKIEIVRDIVSGNGEKIKKPEKWSREKSKM